MHYIDKKTQVLEVWMLVKYLFIYLFIGKTKANHIIRVYKVESQLLQVYTLPIRNTVGTKTTHYYSII